jgi:archaellum component FlaF (FlaF/FlaG flagellin family)
LSNKINTSDAFTGLEAAIVLIAFVVVAAVFAYVVLGAGFFTTQKAQETIYKSVEQSTSNLGSVEILNFLSCLEFSVVVRVTPSLPQRGKQPKGSTP